MSMLKLAEYQTVNKGLTRRVQLEPQEMEVPIVGRPVWRLDRIPFLGKKIFATVSWISTTNNCFRASFSTSGVQSLDSDILNLP